MQLLSLPIELLEEIIDNVDDARDVFALSLSCKLLSTLTIPFPLQYRSLVWPTHDGTWRVGNHTATNANPFGELGLACEDYLSAEPRRWGAIRSLTVTRAGSRFAPRFMQDYVRSDGFVLPQLPESVLNAVAVIPMSVQEKIDRDSARHILAVDNFARVVRRVPHLTAVNWSWFPPQVDSPLWDAIQTTRSLRTVLFVFNTDLTDTYRGCVLSDITSRLIEVISECPLLEEITIAAHIAHNGHHDGTWDIDPMSDCSWPRLRKLDVAQARAGQPTKFTRFLARCEQLEHLRVMDSSIYSVCENNTSLPHLTQLELLNLRLARPLLGVLGPANSKKMRPLRKLALYAPLTRGEFNTLCGYLPRHGSRLESLDIVLHATFEADISTVLGYLPNLAHLAITAHKVLEVLSAARRLRSKLTLAPVNRGPMHEWTNIRFPVLCLASVSSWARCFSQASKLQTLLLRFSGELSRPMQDMYKMYDDTQNISLKDVFRNIVPNAVAVDSAVKRGGRDLGLWIRCVRKELSAAGKVEIGMVAQEDGQV